MHEEYDPKELEYLVSNALENIEQHEHNMLFSFGDTRLLEHLAELLPEHVDRGQVSVILDNLREKLYGGLAGHADPGKTLRNLHAVVSQCRVCPNVKPDPHLPKWNVIDPDVVFVMNTPLSGSEGDRFFVQTLKEVGFRSARLCVTSVVRCYPQENRQPEVDEVSECSTRYLFHELRLMKPQLIVSMGSMPTSVLLGGPTKVTEERGNIFWAGPWPILATYSGPYALRTERQQSELKKDIQKAYEFLYGK